MVLNQLVYRYIRITQEIGLILACQLKKRSLRITKWRCASFDLLSCLLHRLNFWSIVRQVVGATADAGLSLIEVAGEAKHAAELVGTMGIAPSVCTFPGQVISDRLDAEKMEIGLRIVS